ncbi:MAG: tetratricopeptide repeat protein [Bacteroidota bacterium]
MPDPKHIGTQINQPQVQGNLVVQGDVVIYDNGYQAPRFLSALPQVRTAELIGRSSDLKRLAETLSAGQMVVLNGMGGVGKSSLAASYLHAHKEELAHIVWIEQTDGFATALVTNLVLTDRLQLQLTGNLEQDAQLILSRMGSLGGPSLMVIDNAESDLAEYQNLLPQAPDWQVIITSREALDIGQQLDLDVLDEAAAVELFQLHYEGKASGQGPRSEAIPAEVQKTTNDQQLAEITDLLGYLPLSIELVAKTARARRMQPLKKVLELLQARGLQLNRAANVKVDHKADGRVAKVFPYLQSVFHWGEVNELEEWLMKQFIALPPLPISFDYLTALIGLSPDEEAIWDEYTVALESLWRRGWLQYDENEDNYQIHRVIQAVLTEELRPKLQYEDLHRLLNALARSTHSGGNPLVLVKFLPFAQRLNDLLTVEWLAHEDFLVLQRNLAQIYRDLGQFPNSEAILLILEEYSIENYGPQHEITLFLAGQRAVVLVEMGSYKAAYDKLSDLIKIELEEHGGRPEWMNFLLANLGALQTDLGEYPSALQNFEGAIAYGRQFLTEGDPGFLHQQTNLAVLYGRMGETDKAIEQLRDLYQLSLKYLGEDHPATQLRRQNLGELIYETNDFAAARQELESVYAWYQEHLGIQHINSIRAGASLAAVLLAMKQYEPAIQLFERAFYVYLHTFEPGHLPSLQVMMDLGTAYQAQGRSEDRPEQIQKALELYESSLSFCLEHHAFDHPLADKIRNNLANALADFGRFAEAEEFLATAYEHLLKRFGEDHPSTQNCRSNLEAVRARL